MAAGLDYSWGRPDLAAAKAGGVRFVMRYLDTGGSRPDLTKEEVAQIHGHGLALGLIWEAGADTTLGGQAAGRYAAHAAIAAAKALGAPAGTAIYHTVDFDMQGFQTTAVKQYFAGVKSVGGPYLVGCYGGLRATQSIAGSGYADFLWQTLAWSSSGRYDEQGNRIIEWDARANLRQTSNNVEKYGALVDDNESMTEFCGLWPNRTESGTDAADLLAWCAQHPDKVRAILKEYL